MEHGNSSQSFDGCCMQSSEVNLDEALNTLPKLALKLCVTPSFLEKVNQVLFQAPMTEAKSNDNINLQQPLKLKAERFLISLLRIGSWQRVSRNEGDLVAKCYFSRRILAWEFLESDGLKRKIEIHWHDILSLRVLMLKGLSGILEIELTQPPAFYHEIDPKPRKHTQWRSVSDFTRGQAPSYRRHYLEFPPGALDRPLQKILRSDNRLFQLSRQGFPILKSPYFPRHPVGQLHINPQQQQQQQQQQQLQFANVPTYYQTYEPAPLNSPMSEYSSNQMSLMEGQGEIINGGDNVIANQFRGTMMMPSNAAASFLQQVNSSMSFYNNYFTLPQDQLGGLLSPMQQPSMMFQTLANDHHQNNMVLNNSQNGFPNSITDGNLFMQGGLGNNMTSDFGSPNMADNSTVLNSITDGNLFMQGHQTNNMTNDFGIPNMVDDSVLMNNAFSNNGVDGGEMYPVMNWLPDENPFSSSVQSDDFNHHDFNPGPWK